MLVFDQLKKNDPQLRAVAMIVLGGLLILLAGLWWIQIVSSRDYEANLETQSFRTVRIPAVRGKILDRNGVALAESQPCYNVSLYLGDLRKAFDATYSNNVARAKRDFKQHAAEQAKQLQNGSGALDGFMAWLRRKLGKDDKQQFVLHAKDKNLFRQQARYEVASNVVMQISRRLQEPLPLTQILTNFERHYETRLALPFPVKTNLNFIEIARLEEQSAGLRGVELDVQSLRVYPFETTAAHVLGSLKRDDSSAEGEEAYFSFRLPDFRGLVGIEGGYDHQLRGTAGAKSVLVNNLGYRQTENIWSPAEAGQDLTLTIDLHIQQAAERALQSAYGPETRGAIVVMDVHTGDILAMASSPTLNPNYFVDGFPRGAWQHINDLRTQINRATQENYQPGSIFKPVVAMAALEAGLDPERSFRVEANPETGRGMIIVGGNKIRDTAAPGEYNFRRAFKFSSNSYFITNGLRAGIESIVRLGERLHFGERTGLPTRQDTPGNFPSWERIHSRWYDGDTANICIGQGGIDVTPLQMAVMTAAIANGGKVLWPRLVDKIESQDPTSSEPPTIFEKGRVRDELGVSPRTLTILRDAMLADVEDGGTGKAALVPGLRICGKTGTSQKKNARGDLEEYVTWFASYAPYEQPHYTVLIMVEGGGSGGTTCAPLAGQVYRAIQERDRLGNGKTTTVAAAH